MMWKGKVYCFDLGLSRWHDAFVLLFAVGNWRSYVHFG